MKFGHSVSTRVAASVLAGGVVAAMLAGCSGSATQDTSTSDSGSITWWGWTPEIATADAYIAAFNEEYPDIEVTYRQIPYGDYNTTLKPALLSSVGPDVFGLMAGSTGMAPELYKDFAIDLRPAVEAALGEDFASQLAPNNASLTIDDKVVALSVGSVFTGTLWANTQLFDQIGAVPPTTLEEWVDVCEEFAANGIRCFEQGIADPGFNMDLLHALIDDVEPGLYNRAATGEAEWTDPGIIEALGILQEMYTNGIIQPGAVGLKQYPDVNNDFQSGKVAMVMMGTWYMQYTTVASAEAAISAAGVTDVEPFAMIPVLFPDMSGNGNPSPLNGDPDFGVAVNVKSSAIDAATTFAVWLSTNASAQQIVSDALNQIPSLVGTTPNWDAIDLVDADVQRPALEALLAATDKANDPRFSLTPAVVWDGVGAAFVGLQDGSLTPQTAAEAIAAAAAQQQ
ncbi:MAG TPA: extracellular solute-binding protein [Pseudolysinimonas sp.]|nr:extracellular solute-binding protein [Pseudolysinimonas sp.]